MERYIKSVKCKDCRYFIPYEKPVEDFDGRCFVRECETDEEEYCSYSTNILDKILYVVYADTHEDSWGATIEMFGVADNENDLKKICETVKKNGYSAKVVEKRNVRLVILIVIVEFVINVENVVHIQIITTKLLIKQKMLVGFIA